jgi:hypothetical protein
VARNEITLNQAIDKLVTAFDARGWREDGVTARAIARAAAKEQEVDPQRLALAVKQTFLVSNGGLERGAVADVIAAALGNATIVASPPAPAAAPTTSNISINNTGTFIGPVGSGGVVSRVHVQRQEVMGDQAVRALVTRYADDPQVREIVDSDLPVTEKRSRLTSLLKASGGFASDTLAKIATALLSPS